jgi:hypothetical protein
MRFAGKMFVCFVGLAVFAAPASAEPDGAYVAFRAARPAGKPVPVQNLVLVREAFRLSFDQGSFWFLPDVEGRTVGAVFVGQGSWELKPTTTTERHHLRVLTRSRDLVTLTDRFERLVLMFTDDTAAEIRAASSGSGAPPDAKPDTAWDHYLKAQRRTFRVNLHLRVLMDVLEKARSADGFFVAYSEGKKQSAGLVAVDPRGVEALGLGAGLGREQVAYVSLDEQNGGLWYLAKGGRTSPAGDDTDALDYRIDTRIRKNRDLEGVTSIHFRTLRDGVRVVRINLLPKLRIGEASFAPGEVPSDDAFAPVSVIQEGADDDADAAVVLPAPLASGSVATLRLRYKGDEVLDDAGDNNYVVEARQSWYPNLGTFTDPATFDLTYRVPKKNEVISVGRLASVETDGDFAVSHWKAEKPIRVAGFNYGRFKKLEKVDTQTGFTVRVFTNPGKPTFAREIESSESIARFNTEKAADSALVDGMNTIRTGEVYFGPLQEREIAITQQSQWNFGQSWPGLVFLPYLAFLDSMTRMTLGLAGASSFVEQVGPHEVAHQWFGHEVGWATYHDEWLSEGFAEFSSALVLQQTVGTGHYMDFFDKARTNILRRPAPGSGMAEEVGPITMGHRLAEGRHGDAYIAVIYSKGAWVLHMLRVMMRDPQSKNADAPFIALMHDWVTTWGGKNPSTADFQATVERHMLPAMNLSRDGKMDWFFDQWVRGIEIPKVTSHLAVQEAGPGTYKITGEVVQAEISETFKSPVGLYAEFEKGEIAKLGTIVLVGPVTVPVNNEVKLPKKPKRVFLDAFRDVLTRD